MTTRKSILSWALPPGVSLLIHATLVGLLIVVGSRAASLASPDPKSTRIPLAELEFTAPPPALQTQKEDPGPTDTPKRDPAPTPQPSPSVLDRSAKALSEPTPVSTQAMSAATLEQLGNQSTSLAAEPSNAPAPISFAGVSTGAARSIVYVVDASGATLTSFTYIRERLLQSIDRLSPTQRFQVIAFRKLGDSTYISPSLETTKNKLPRATRHNKQIVADWITQMLAQGRSNPVDGLEAALKLNPDMVLLISRGIERTEAPWAGGLKHVRQQLDQLNPLDPISGTRPAVIKTIQLLDEDPTGIMRTIGVFHGDGHNDHQIITYNQLANPEPQPQTPPPTNTDARLTTAEDQLALLKATGAYYRATTSVPTSEDTESIDSAIIRINTMLAKSDPDDPRTALLIAETLLLTSDTSSTQTNELQQTLQDAVFVSPDLDARRRIVLAQLARSPADLLALLEEQSQLNYAPITAAHAILALTKLQPTEPNSELANQPPFTTDAAWALMLSQTRSLALLNQSETTPLAPLLELRSAVPGLSPQIDASIVQLVKHTNTDVSTLSALPRFIVARARISKGSTDDRMDAINILLELTRDTDEHLAEESLWLACLGSRALNTRDSAKTLVSAASMLANRFPDHPGAPDALAGAIDTASQSRSPELQTALTSLLRQAVSQYPTRIEIDLWKLQLINLTTGREQHKLIQSLTPATRESDLGAEILHANALATTTDNPLLHAINTARILDALRSPLANHWHRAAAELEVDTDPVSAVIRLSRLVQKNPTTDDLDLELLYAQSLLNADQPDQALPRLASLVELLDQHNPAQRKHFWHCWTLILETTLAHGNNADLDNARAHLTRLKLIDPKLGPEPFATRLTIVQNTLHSEP